MGSRIEFFKKIHIDTNKVKLSMDLLFMSAHSFSSVGETDANENGNSSTMIGPFGVFSTISTAVQSTVSKKCKVAYSLP